MSENDGYDSLRKLDLELREKHHRHMQVKDRNDNHQREIEALKKENEEIQLQFAALKLQDEATEGKLQAVQTKLESVNKDIDRREQAIVKFRAKIEDRQKKKDYIQQLHADKFKALHQKLDDNEEQFRQMPFFAKIEKKKEVLAQVSEVDETVAVLNRKIAESMALEEEIWTKFKAICVESAQNWKDRKDQEEEKKKLQASSTRYFSNNFVSAPNAPKKALPFGSQRRGMGNWNLPADPWTMMSPRSGSSGSSFGGFADAWQKFSQKTPVFKMQEQRTSQRTLYDSSRKMSSHSKPETGPSQEKSKLSMSTKNLSNEKISLQSKSATCEEGVPPPTPQIKDIPAPIEKFQSRDDEESSQLTVSTKNLTIEKNNQPTTSDPVTFDQDVFQGPMSPPENDVSMTDCSSPCSGTFQPSSQFPMGKQQSNEKNHRSPVSNLIQMDEDDFRRPKTPPGNEVSEVGGNPFQSPEPFQFLDVSFEEGKDHHQYPFNLTSSSVESDEGRDDDDMPPFDFGFSQD